MWIEILEIQKTNFLTFIFVIYDSYTLNKSYIDFLIYIYDMIYFNYKTINKIINIIKKLKLNYINKLFLN